MTSSTLIASSALTNTIRDNRLSLSAYVVVNLSRFSFTRNILTIYLMLL